MDYETKGVYNAVYNIRVDLLNEKRRCVEIRHEYKLALERGELTQSEYDEYVSEETRRIEEIINILRYIQWGLWKIPPG